MSTQTMIDAAFAEFTTHPEMEPRPFGDRLAAALIAFAEELEALAASTLAANKRGAKGKAAIYTEGAALLRGRAAELETHGPITDAQARRAAALAETEAGAERLLQEARPNGKDMENLKALVGAPQTESTALEVGQTCGVEDEMGYICELAPHPHGSRHAILAPDGSWSVSWPDLREIPALSDTRQADIAGYLKGERDELPDFGQVASPVADLGPVSPELAGIVTALNTANPSLGNPLGLTGAQEMFSEIQRFGDAMMADVQIEAGIPADALFVVSDIGHDEHGNRIISGAKIEGISLMTQPDPFATPTAADQFDDVFFVADANAGRPPWRLDPAPVPFGFDPETAPGGVPGHVSYSQITTAESCGLQLRIKKRDLVKGQPGYATTGGKTFHACVELIERRRLDLVSYGTVDRVLAGDLAACAELFVHNFDLEIAAAVREFGIPVERWKVAAKGAEDDAWWRHNGALMVRDYVAWSEAKHAEGWAIINIPGKMLGLELNLNTPVGWDIQTSAPVNLNAILDLVWFRWEPATPDDADGVPVLRLHIEDGKSGAKPVTETFQLGLYAHVLKRVVEAEFPPPVVAKMRITGSYYDARNGKSGEELSPLDLHSWAEIEYRALTTLGMHAAGIYPANPKTEWGGPCNMCDVRHACPIMAMKD